MEYFSMFADMFAGFVIMLYNIITRLKVFFEPFDKWEFWKMIPPVVNVIEDTIRLLVWTTIERPVKQGKGQ